MASMNAAIRLPEIHQSMVVMATEMQKAGLIEEMMDDMMDTEDIEEEAGEEVEKVLLELNLNMEAAMPSTGGAKPLRVEEPEEPEPVEDDIETIQMQQRLNALKGV